MTENTSIKLMIADTEYRALTTYFSEKTDIELTGCTEDGHSQC